MKKNQALGELWAGLMLHRMEGTNSPFGCANPYPASPSPQPPRPEEAEKRLHPHRADDCGGHRGHPRRRGNSQISGSPKSSCCRGCNRRAGRSCQGMCHVGCVSGWCHSFNILQHQWRHVFSRLVFRRLNLQSKMPYYNEWIRHSCDCSCCNQWRHVLHSRLKHLRGDLLF